MTTFLWILERALHNEAFLGQLNLLKELKFKVSKVKLQFVNKPSHFAKVGCGVGGGIGVSGGVGVPSVVSGGCASGIVPIVNKSRWPGGPVSGVGPLAKKPSVVPGMERKNSGASLQSFSAMVQATQPPPALPTAQHAENKNYFSAMAGQVQVVTHPNSGQQQQQQYSKSSSYPSFSQNLKFSSPHLVGHPPSAGVNLPQMDQPPPSTTNSVLVAKAGQTMLGLCNSNSNSSNGTSISNNGPSGGGGGVMYHRHSMNSLMPVNMSSGGGGGQVQVEPKKVVSGGMVGMSVSGQRQQVQGTMPLGGGAIRQQENNENIDIGNTQQQQQQQQQCNNSKDRNNICDINSRLEFLCLQMTEQAIN